MKKIIKKAFAFIASFGILATNLAAVSGCAYDTDDRISIVATIFPQYDWIKQIIGEQIDRYNLTLLLDNGTDLHSYQPTADDIVTIANCDMFVYVGGESDEWVDGVLRQKINDDMIVVDLMEKLGDAVKEEEEPSGAESDHDHDHDHENEDEREYDEHVWLSLRNARTLCEELARQICVLDPDNAATYDENARAYCEKLTSLDAEYTETVTNATQKTLLFADRFSFRYLADDYDLDYYAAFSGCSAESEASFETVVFLAEKINELGLKVVIKLEGSDDTLARTIVTASKAQSVEILTMDSMQSVTAKDVSDGASYLSIMQRNLTVLKEALR